MGITNGGGGLVQWAGFLWAALLGAVGAVIGVARWTWGVRDRLAGIEQSLARLEARISHEKVETMALIDRKLAEDRHQNVYPEIMKQATIPIDKLEEEQKRQGQNIAILLDRDKYERLLEKLVQTQRRPQDDKD